MRNFDIATTATNVYDKMYSVIFAKKLAEEEAAAKKRLIVTIAICVGAAVLAVAAAVTALFVVKKKNPEFSIKATAKNVKDKIVAKLPCKKNAEECDCEFDCEEAVECEAVECEACEAAE